MLQQELCLKLFFFFVLSPALIQGDFGNLVRNEQERTSFANQITFWGEMRVKVNKSTIYFLHCIVKWYFSCNFEVSSKFRV